MGSTGARLAQSALGGVIAGSVLHTPLEADQPFGAAGSRRPPVAESRGQRRRGAFTVVPGSEEDARSGRKQDSDSGEKTDKVLVATVVARAGERPAPSADQAAVRRPFSAMERKRARGLAPIGD